MNYSCIELVHAELQDVVGKTIKEIKYNQGENDELWFNMTDGTTYLMTHHQDCCECVTLVDGAGEATELKGTIVTMEHRGEEARDKNYYSFYEIQTTEGFATLRWEQEYSEYYSTDVSFERKVSNG